MDEVVGLTQVSRRYGSIRALDPVSLSIPAGQFVAVMGATGSGKSTLLHCAAGLDRPTSGRVTLAGREISRMREGRLTRWRRDRAGFVFQSYNLLSELTVQQNVALPTRLGGPRARSVGDVLADVGLAGYGRRPVAELSGGQRQRVAVARALITAPAVIFADEPTGALDPTTGAQILGLLREAATRDGVTVVMVTHDPAAAAWTDRVVLLRGGSLAADGPATSATEIATALRAVTTTHPAPTNPAPVNPAPVNPAPVNSAAAGVAGANPAPVYPVVANPAAVSAAPLNAKAASSAGANPVAANSTIASPMVVSRAVAGPAAKSAGAKFVSEWSAVARVGEWA